MTDRERLRELAWRQMELAKSPENEEKRNEWFRHNAARPGRPMIHLEAWTFGEELFPSRLTCEDREMRGIEQGLLSNFINAELFGDDRVVPDYYPVYVPSEFIPFGIDDEMTAEGIGYSTVKKIEDLERDFHLLGESTFSIDHASADRQVERLGDIFGDILEPRKVMGGLYSVPTQKIVNLMGLENMMFSMYDYPELFKEMMNRFAEDTVKFFRALEGEGLLPTKDATGWCQGSFCFNEELPDAPKTTRDLCGFMDSQESSSISPDMYEEFIFPCYEKISKEMGLLSYGCCEPTHPIWERCLKKLQNLRKVSVSPWCDEEAMGENLRGGKVIYHRKPSPNFLGVDEVLDEEALRAHINKTLHAARGCVLEIAQRDVYTLHGNVEKARRYIEIWKQEIEKTW